MSKVYYNEIDQNCVAWLKQAMMAGIIAVGDIDSRPIQEVTFNDLIGYTQHHFFAGIGGWSIALRLAGWSDDRPVWTGSCPCQPFSTAGKQKGNKDERHLWPYWFNLIRQSKPSTIFGEQVSSAIAFGWLDAISHDLEAEGYAVGSAVLPACSVGAPHKRDRLWFVGDSRCERKRDAQYGFNSERQHSFAQREQTSKGNRLTDPSPLGDTQHNGQFATTQQRIIGEDARQSEKGQNCTEQFEGASYFGDMANTNESGLEGHRESEQVNATQRRHDASQFAENGLAWIDCPDGKQRPVESSICLLVDGIPSKLRKAALHGFGNAIVPQVAAEFVAAYMEVVNER